MNKEFKDKRIYIRTLHNSYVYIAFHNSYIHGFLSCRRISLFTNANDVNFDFIVNAKRSLISQGRPKVKSKLLS